MKRRLAAMYGVVLVSVSLVMSPACFGEVRHGDANAAEMEMHHLHILLNQGITMVTEGTNLVLLAGMGAAPALDRPTLRHGQMMIANGRELIRRSIDGPEMASLSKSGRAASSLVRYSRELGEAMLAYLKDLEKLDVDSMSSRRTMTLQRMIVILNHALEMASEGANMIMLARMGMAGEVDRFSLEHGERAIFHARQLYRETMESEAMKDLREFDVTGESAPMINLTRDLAEDVSKLMELLARMPPPASMAPPSR